MVPVSLKAIQEQQTVIREQKARVEQKDAQIASLDSRPAAEEQMLLRLSAQQEISRQR